MNKIKALILLTVLMFAGMPATAQDEIFDSPDNYPHFGIRVGLDISSPTWARFETIKFKMFDTGAGFSIGAIYNIPLWKNLYFEPGISFSYNTMGCDIIDSEGASDFSFRRFGVRVPFAFGYRFNFSPCAVSVFTGPQLDFGLVGRYHVSSPQGGESESAYGDGGSIHRTGIGWKFGAGVNWQRYVFEISGNVGMNNMLKNSGFRCRDNTVTITVGYNF